MEKSRLEILSEIQETLAELKTRIAEVENRLAGLEGLPETPETAIPVIEEPDPIYVDSPVESTAAELVPEVSEELDDLPDEEPAPEASAEPVEDMSPIDISIDEEDFQDPGFAEPEPEPEPEPSGNLLEDEIPAAPKANINDRQERRAKKTVMDVMGQKLAWKSAIPGTPVKNVISAISLNDRVLFINTLFKEDPLAFQEAIAAFNGMSSFAEAEEYVREKHPEWNLNSDLVFRLMMAVRRKLK